MTDVVLGDELVSRVELPSVPQFIVKTPDHRLVDVAHNRPPKQFNGTLRHRVVRRDGALPVNAESVSSLQSRTLRRDKLRNRDSPAVGPA
jgi:hypothetical protein